MQYTYTYSTTQAFPSFLFTSHAHFYYQLKDKNNTNIQGVFLTGSAQKVLSMELVPHNSKKTTKYTGSAQYIKNGKVSQRSSNHLFLRHYAGEKILTSFFPDMVNHQQQRTV